MKIQKAKISDIKINPDNPRIIKDDKFINLVQSIKDFPEMLDIRPVVVNNKMVIIGGNMRFKAAKEAGLKDIPIIIANLSEAKQKEFIIKDNVSGGDWDWDKLANEWDTDKLNCWGLDVPDFNSSEDAVDDDFEIQLKKETDIKYGDLFEIGDNRLLCGDPRNANELETLMNSQRADLYITDPPYGVAYKGKTKESLVIKKRMEKFIIIKQSKISRKCLEEKEI